MAKNQLPMMKAGGSGVGKLVKILGALAVVAFIVQSPVEAASWVQAAWESLGSASEAIMTFAQGLGA